MGETARKIKFALIRCLTEIFSVANIFGLTIGLTCCMLIAIYLYHEFTYDHHHQKIDRLYKVATTSIIQDKEENGLATPSPVGPALQKEFPEIEGMARSLALFIDDKTLLQYKKENENKNLKILLLTIIMLVSKLVQMMKMIMGHPF